MQDMKKPFDNVSFFVFFHNIGLNFAQILPLRPHQLCFFWWYPMKYVRIQLILIILIQLRFSSSKKTDTTSKNCFLGAQITQKRDPKHLKWKTIFFVEITKAYNQLSNTFILSSISLAELWIFFCFVWCFLSKMGHFQLKQ